MGSLDAADYKKLRRAYINANVSIRNVFCKAWEYDDAICENMINIDFIPRLFFV